MNKTINVNVSENTAAALILEIKARELYSDIYNFVEKVYTVEVVDKLMEEDFDKFMLGLISKIEEYRNDIITGTMCDVKINPKEAMFNTLVI